MATSARFALLHLVHIKTLIARSGGIKIRMTVFATVGGNMGNMTEDRAAGTKIDLFDGVALLTVRLDSESGLAVMARTAGVASLHGRHAVSLAGLAGDKKSVMTIGTFEQGHMGRMSESCIPGFFNCECNIDSRLVTFVAVTLDAENGRPVMTAAT